MNRLTFREYYESKKRLLNASESVPRVRKTYSLNKYCKFPVFESLDSDERVFVSFKPNDKIDILWEHVNEHDFYPTPKSICLISEGGDIVYPYWNNKKMKNWVDTNTKEADE